MMIQEKHDLPATSLWVYGYELVPPVLRDRLGGIQDVLDAAHSEAELAGRIWEARLVNGDHITHILVVSGTPTQDLDVNHRLEAELGRLEARFSVTASLEVEPRQRRGSSPDRPPGSAS